MTGAGIKKGLPEAICDKIFCTVIIPMLTYGSELWVLENDEVKMLVLFQKNLAGKFKKLSSPNCPDRWLSIDKYIKITKMFLFLRIILNMHERSVCRQTLRKQADQYDDNKEICARNCFGSPIYDLLNVCKELGMYDLCLYCIRNGKTFSKNDWKDIIRKKVWSL